MIALGVKKLVGPSKVRSWLRNQMHLKSNVDGLATVVRRFSNDRDGRGIESCSRGIQTIITQESAEAISVDDDVGHESCRVELRWVRQ